MLGVKSNIDTIIGQALPDSFAIVVNDRMRSRCYIFEHYNPVKGKNLNIDVYKRQLRTLSEDFCVNRFLLLGRELNAENVTVRSLEYLSLIHI